MAIDLIVRTEKAPYYSERERQKKKKEKERNAIAKNTKRQIRLFSMNNYNDYQFARLIDPRD